MLAAFGLWSALPVTGYWLFLRRHYASGIAPYPAITAVALATTVGILVWSVPLLLSAIAGLYSPAAIGLLGWAVTLAGGIGLYRESSPRPPARRRPDVWDGVLAAGLAVAAVLYLGFPTDSIWGWRDFGLYTNHAIWIAHHGRLDVPYPWAGEVGDLLAQVYVPLQGLYATQPTMTVQFGHLFPVWLAQAFGTAGYQGLIRLNPVFALLSLATFYGLCRLILPKSFAVMAALFLAVVPGQIWLARITLTEILTQLLIWAGLTLLLQALRNDAPPSARWAGALLGLAAFVRIDSLVLIPLLLLSHLVLRVAEPPCKRSSRVWLALYQTALPAFVLAVGYYALFSAPYFTFLLPQLRLIGILSALCLGALLVGLTRLAPLARPYVPSRPVLAAFAVGVLALSAYAYWIRPYDAPYVLYRGTGTGLDGERTHVEDSLVNLGLYLSPPVVWAAIIGWIAALWVMARKARWLELAPVALVAGGFSALYIWNQSITPDHFWAIRRFIPVTIPAMILFAGLSARMVLVRLPRRWAALTATLTLAGLVGFIVWVDTPLAAHAERDGSYGQMRELSEALPDGEAIIGPIGGRWMTPLFLAFDHPLIQMRMSSPEARAAFERWVLHRLSQGRPIYLIADGEFPERWLKGLDYTQVASIPLSQEYLERTMTPIPRMVEDFEMTVNVYRVSTANVTYVDRDIGGTDTWFIHESGFHPQRFLRTGQPVRWTDGAGTLTVPLRGQPRPERLRIEVSLGRPALRQLRIVANGRELFDGRVGDEGRRWRETFPLSGVPLGDRLTIEILSDTFVPPDPEAARQEPKRGVLVREVRLLDDR